ncbi:MAG: hypothetical protein LVQ64_06675, partial [Thermoplasmatales archaeon]|nr:hypothetical protein [Thermoplasmatales archaeon]
MALDLRKPVGLLSFVHATCRAVRNPAGLFGPVRPRLFGQSSKRHCLFIRDGYAQPFAFTKGDCDHVLGTCQVPEAREKFAKCVWERLIDAADNPDARASEDIEHLPAT